MVQNLPDSTTNLVWHNYVIFCLFLILEIFLFLASSVVNNMSIIAFTKIISHVKNEPIIMYIIPYRQWLNKQIDYSKVQCTCM